MLTLQPLTGPRESETVLESFDPLKATWLVSDLKSKFDLNRRLLTKSGFVPGDGVLRASELWRMLLVRVRPDLQVVSREFALTLIASEIEKLDLAWAKTPGAAQAAFQYLTQLMPILSHSEGPEMMIEWFEKNEASRERWGRWFDLTHQLYFHFLREGFLAPAWVSGVLVNEPDLQNYWTKPLIVDLGAELNQVEADLLWMMSDFIDITVLRPEPSWVAEYGNCLVGYDLLEKKLGGKRAPPVKPAEQSKRGAVVYRKYTTMIAEVKDATAEIRSWLDNDPKLKASDLAIVAPDIETYWPSLSSYLAQEGLLTQKDSVARLHSFPDIARWLSVLRLKTGAFDEADIELAVFDAADVSHRPLSYDKFRTLYAYVYGREDLSREASVGAKFQIELQAGDFCNRDDFVAFALKCIPEHANYDRIEAAFKRVFGECPEGIRLSVRRWLGYLEQVCGRTEVRIESGVPDGIACLNLTSAESSTAQRMVILGLTENALRKSVGTAILGSDLSSLGQQYGFHLASDDQVKLEFEARWIIEALDRDLILCAPETDFSGSPQAPSWLWLNGSREQSHDISVTVPEPTRWDELQLSPIEKIAAIREWSPERVQTLSRSMDEDNNQVVISTFSAAELSAISPSKIESYLECPFTYAAKHLFGLADVNELDLEVDPLRRGSFMHSVFERLTVEPFQSIYKVDELDSLLDDVRRDVGFQLADDRLWPSMRAKYADLSRRFLTIETDYRARFPKAKTVGREISVDGYLQPDSSTFSRENSGTGVKFSGRIDRIDEDDRGNVIVFDYKSSDASASQFGSWIKKNKVQLLLYSLAVESGLTELGPKNVVGAIYYVSKPFSRDRGMLLKTGEQGLYVIDEKSRKQNVLELDKKEPFFEEARQLISKAVSGIQAGRFEPNPRDPKNCFECRWSTLCRTPHLN
jgi:ATP-dependent helicase/nuclease subunit B